MNVGLTNGGKQRGQEMPGKGRPGGKKFMCKGPAVRKHKASRLVWCGYSAGICRGSRERWLGLVTKGQSSRLRCLDKRPWGAMKVSEQGKAMVKVFGGQKDGLEVISRR